MPIKLDDIQPSAVVKTYSPMFFSKDLTGSGGKTGLLCAARDPVYTGKKVRTTSDAVDPIKRRITNNGVTTSYIPLGILTSQAWQMVNKIPLPETLGPIIAEEASGNTYKYHLDMEPHALTLQVSAQGQGQSRVIEKKLTVCWRISVIRVNTNIGQSNATMTQKPSLNDIMPNGTLAAAQHVFVNFFTCNPPKKLQAICADMAHAGLSLDTAAIDAAITSTSLYEGVAKRSEVWQTSADQELRWLLDSLRVVSQNGRVDIDRMRRDMLMDICAKLEAYRMPLGLYRNIYNDLTSVLSDADCKAVCKANLNLLLSDTLAGIDADKQNLMRVLPKGQPAPSIDSFYSNEQRNAIASDSPLTLVQSGAGSGKSTLIKGRLDYMRDCGVDLKDALVLSFTNAAADHILDIAPDVHSMTIAKMIHTIYTANHPSHELSTEDTLANTLEIFFPNDQFAHNFILRLRDVMKEDDQRALTRLNSFVENHFDNVMHCLDVTGQTTLNLEIIICYQCIDSMVEPPEVKSRHIIIDEVQDNSIFEFVYILRYVAKNKESLFIIGKLLLPM